MRPLLAKPGENALWIAWDCERLAYHSVYIAFTRITKMLFGKEINPHLLRDCAATTLASKSLDAAMAARGLLGHRKFKTTEKYYVHAQQLEASRKINAALAAALNEHLAVKALSSRLIVLYEVGLDRRPVDVRQLGAPGSGGHLDEFLLQNLD